MGNKAGGRSGHSKDQGPDLNAVIEKRNSLRLPLVVLEVKWKKFNQVFIARSENISMGGLFLATDRPLQIGDQFPVQFVLPDQKTEITCTGEVTWTRKNSGESQESEGVGVRFVGLENNTKKAVGNWIKKREALAKKRT
ncbi:MAG TPA: TIGR02266 family protein [Nitrospiria bacterium]